MPVSRFRQRLVTVLLWTALLSSPSLAEERDGADSSAAGNWLRNLQQRFRPSLHERNHPQVRGAFREVVQNARRSTVRVLCDDLQVALGAIVDPRGYIVTKDSELRGDILCLFMDGQRLKAQIVAQQPDYDLALLKVPTQQLLAVQWSDSSPAVGAWLATTGLNVDAKAVGVISTPPRAIAAPSAALGVKLEPSKAGPRISEVIRDSGAAKARLLAGDVILDIDGKTMKSPASVSLAVSGYRPGDQVVLSIRRGGRLLSIQAVLSNRLRLGNEQAEIMDNLGGPLSNRRSGFPIALQHDTVLRPRDCGGPLVDLTGKVVGINIARASRVASYAIPAEAIQQLLPSLMAQDLAAIQTAATETPMGLE